MLDNDPLWYKDAVIYELHVRAFHDSDGDGMGDFRGLAQKLDYLQDLGVTAIWLLPFYPSPLKDDGYDIADYSKINPDYGTLKDFQRFLTEAHKRGLRVITELVINHTSDQHPWFQRARRAPPGSPERDFYVWSDNPDKYAEARIIFQDFETSNWTWDPLAKAYFWHRFYHHQPDLNYDNPEVWQAIFPILDFWMEMGVDGMRLDAVPYLYQREGTNCENLPETHDFLKALRKHVDDKFAGRMLLAEANQWPEDSVAYFGDGDECHMAFHFPVMPRMFMAIHQEDRFPIVDIMDQTPAIADNCQWCMFLRNHDELTLEMVTDEERDYMYRAYASDRRARVNLGIRRRLAPLLGNNRRRIELMNALLFSLPGTPVIYYGDEIGMGDNIYLGDRNGVRTPVQWSGDRNAGFSRANPQQLYLPVIIDPEYHYEGVNIDAQQNNLNSLLWWMKRLIALRKQFRAFSRGNLQFLHPENRRILSFLRRYVPPDAENGEEECILVVANLSRFVQYVELDLSEFQGYVPVEVFGRNPFPPIGRLPYLLTLSPHSFYWFTLDPHALQDTWDLRAATSTETPRLHIPDRWDQLFHPPHKTNLERVLPGFLTGRRWFGGKARSLKSAKIREALPIPFAGERTAWFLVVQAEFSEGAAEQYMVPVAFGTGEGARLLEENLPHAIVAKVQLGDEEGLLHDALIDEDFAAHVLEMIQANGQFDTGVDGLAFTTTASPQLQEICHRAELHLTPSISRAEQSNSSVLFGAEMILKFYRRLDEGAHPEAELGRYLTDVRRFPHTAALLGAVELQRGRGEPAALAILQKYEPNEGDAWKFTLDELSRYFERVLTTEGHSLDPPQTASSVIERFETEPPEMARELIGNYLETASLLGRRTAELHVALASETENPALAPEAFGKLYQRSSYQSMRNLVGKGFQHLRRRLESLPEEDQEQARVLLVLEPEILRQFQSAFDEKLTGLRIRCHGDYHLGQVLWTGKDFIIIDFEGEPARSLYERRLKRSPLTDVAGMLRSFHYAAYGLFLNKDIGGSSFGLMRPADAAEAENWVQFWYEWVGASFLASYWRAASGQKFLPQSTGEFNGLLRAFLLEKAIYELNYELNHRPDWVQIPMIGILKLLGERV